MNLTPINGCVLVRLTDVYENISVPDKKYDTKTSGILEKVAANVLEIGGIQASKLIGKKVFFESYKDDTSREENGFKYSLIKAEDLKGYEDAPTDA